MQGCRAFVQTLVLAAQQKTVQLLENRSLILERFEEKRNRSDEKWFRVSHEVISLINKHTLAIRKYSYFKTKFEERFRFHVR